MGGSVADWSDPVDEKNGYDVDSIPDPKIMFNGPNGESVMECYVLERVYDDPDTRAVTLGLLVGGSVFLMRNSTDLFLLLINMIVWNRIIASPMCRGAVRILRGIFAARYTGEF